MGFEKMKSETSLALIKSALDFADGESIAFAFQGGEPTLAGLDYFENFVRTVDENNSKKSNIFYSLQTNGTMINNEWGEFFHRNKFLIGLSLDGNAEQNKFRKRPDGENAIDDILNAAAIFKRRGVDFNILTVLTGYCAENGEAIYKYFRSKGFKYLQFIPCLRPFDSDEKSELYMTVDQYTDFLIRVFNLYVKDYVRGNYISIRQFDNWVRLYLNQPAEQCGILGYCSHQFVSESNGNIYPCDFYCTDEWLLGNIMTSSLEDMAKSDKARDFIRESIRVPDKCKKCRVYPLCRAGGCKRTQLSEDYCRAYSKFFNSCLPLFRVFANEKPNI